MATLRVVNLALILLVFNDNIFIIILCGLQCLHCSLANVCMSLRHWINLARVTAPHRHLDTGSTCLRCQHHTDNAGYMTLCRRLPIVTPPPLDDYGGVYGTLTASGKGAAIGVLSVGYNAVMFILRDRQWERSAVGYNTVTCWMFIIMTRHGKVTHLDGMVNP